MIFGKYFDEISYVKWMGVRAGGQEGKRSGYLKTLTVQI